MSSSKNPCSTIVGSPTSSTTVSAMQSADSFVTAGWVSSAVAKLSTAAFRCSCVKSPVAGPAVGSDVSDEGVEEGVEDVAGLAVGVSAGSEG